MTTTVKITALTDIGANLAGTTLVPVVNMAGTPTTQRANVNNIANYVLNKATGANLGPVANVKITGGTAGQVLTTNGSNLLSWATLSGGSNTQVQFNDAGSFGGNSGFTFNKTTGIFTSPFVAGNGNGLSNIQGANISGFVANSNVANTALAVAAANVSGLGNIATINLNGSNSNILTGNGTFVALPVINANTVIWSTAPVANTSNGIAGQAAYDSGGNLYVCVVTNTWAKFTGTTSW